MESDQSRIFGYDERICGGESRPRHKHDRNEEAHAAMVVSE